MSVFFAALCVFALAASPQALAEPKGVVTMFHAGSLTMPFEAMEKAFEAKYPGVDLQREPSGSQAAARKVTDLNKPCDIMASADFKVIDKMLIPAYADWNIRFATNQMVLCYTDKSRHASEISAENWYEVLQKKDVVWGHSDPNLDPCGYRSLMVLQLAEKHYGIPGLNDKLLANRPQENVRPKSVELISLLQSANMGYALFPQLTVANNITYGLRYRRHDREAAKKSIRRLVDDLGIVDLGFLYELNVAVLDTMFRSHVTKGSAVDLGLDIGTEVQVSFKASAVHTF